MRAKIHSFLSKRYTVLAVVVLIALLTVSIANVPYFVGLGLALITLWSSRWKWSDFGMHTINVGQTVLRAIAYSIILFVLVDFIITPPLEYLFGPANYESFDALRGNLPSTLVFMLIMWVVAAFGEEFLYRGYYMKHLARVFGHTRNAWIAAGLFSSILFGLAHQYQGVTGVIQTGIFGLFMAYIFIKNPKNLTLLIFIHGFYNTIGILLIYLNSERLISDFLLNR